MRPRSIIIAGVLGTAAGMAGAAPPATTLDFVPASLTPTQNARVLLVNLALPDRRGSPPDPCHGQLQFFEYGGKPIGEAHTFNLEAGKVLLVTAPSGGYTAVRAHVDFPSKTPSGTPNICRATQAGFEVFDMQSQETKLMNPGVIRGFNPQPDPPG